MDEAIPDRVNKDLELRSSGHIWAVRILQVIFAIVILAIDAKVASEWGGIDCSTPSNIAYIIAIVEFPFPLFYGAFFSVHIPTLLFEIFKDELLNA